MGPHNFSDKMRHLPAVNPRELFEIRGKISHALCLKINTLTWFCEGVNSWIGRINDEEKIEQMSKQRLTKITVIKN